MAKLQSRGLQRFGTGTSGWYHAPLRTAPAPLTALLLALGCSGAPTATLTASSEPGLPSPLRPPPRAVAAWFAEVPLYPLVSGGPFVSQHLGREHLAELRANPIAAAAYRSLQPETRFEVGARVVELLRDLRTGESGPIFAIERVEGGWEYWVLDALGQVQARGAPALCHGCHAGAFTYPLFGIPRIAGAQESAASLPRSRQ